mmetsp:Transcript_13454/g.25356  ORF Transcript_13454/g.25356 Transcript_13454/m.25356 type:complete len:617 (+) Transcript_13454:5-1855(+)
MTSPDVLRRFQQIDWEGFTYYSKQRQLNYSLKLKPGELPENIAEFLSVFEVESSKFRCTISQKLMVIPSKVDKKYYERSVSNSSRVSSRFSCKIRTFALKTLNMLHELCYEETERTLDILAECMSVLSERFNIFKIRALSKLSFEHAEYVLTYYSEVKGSDSLNRLLSIGLAYHSLDTFTPLYLLCLKDPCAYTEPWDTLNRLLEINSWTVSIEVLEILLPYFDQIQLEALNRALTRYSRGTDMLEALLRLELAAKELFIKLTYLKVLKRLQMSVQQASASPSTSGERLNLVNTQQNFTETLASLRSLSSPPEVLDQSCELEALFLELRPSLEAAAAASVEALNETAETKLQQAAAIERGVCPVLKEKNRADTLFWISRDTSLNALSLGNHIQSRICSTIPPSNYHKCWCSCAGGEFIIVADTENLFKVDLLRDFHTVKLGRLLKPRHSHGMAYDQGFVYVVSGRYQGKVYECERYSLRQGKSELIGRIPRAFKKPSTITLNRSLYVVGTADDKGSHQIEVMCLITLSWRMLGVKLPTSNYSLPILFSLPGFNEVFYIRYLDNTYAVNPSSCYLASYTSPQSRLRGRVESKVTTAEVVGVDLNGTVYRLDFHFLLN